MDNIFKVWGVNLSAIILTEFNIEKVLEYIVLILSILYTAYKMHIEYKNGNKKDPDAA